MLRNPKTSPIPATGRWFAAVLLAGGLGLSSCTVPSHDSGQGQGRAVAAGGIYKIGTPYQIQGDWYYPQENDTYDNIGTASWYGPKFHGRRTANGEIFDMDLLTAAHPTLPMPVRVKVTNLENNKSVIVRLNDRGPFAKDREIDMSRRAAEVLGFKEQGTAQVRVQYLGRAPLYDVAGRVIRKQEPDRFIVDKPKTPRADRRVAAAPIESVAVRDVDGNRLVEPKEDALKILASKRFAVQAGVFSKRANAETLKNKLSGIEPSRVVEVKVGGSTYYRVKLGGANLRSEAREMLERLLASGHKDAVIIEQ
jgi:rare lipoprotein A